jgi:rRNA maturation RNase YbeY
MIQFHSETDFTLEKEKLYSKWISNALIDMKKEEGDINYVFCDDAYLLNLNQTYLNHDTLTDIISFDYSNYDVISGDIFISIERVRENAIDFKVAFKNELQRVLIHGILHFVGYNDKTNEEKEEMRNAENHYIYLLNHI